MYFTYLIGWAKFNKFYYGVRYKDEITTDSLGTSYFSSSRYVKKFIEDNGNPDIIQIRKIFTCKQKAKKWEETVIRRMNIIYDDKWLNKSNANSFRDVVMDEDIKKRISDVKKGKKLGKYYNNGVNNRIIKDNEIIPEDWISGRIHSEKQISHYKNLNNLLTPEKRKSAAVKCAAKTKGKSKPNGHGEKVSKATKGVKKPWLKGENNPSKRPEVREKISKSHENRPPTRWYTDGINNTRAEEGKQPIGWRIGRVLNAK